mgnify:CR=1 FL=1
MNVQEEHSFTSKKSLDFILKQCFVQPKKKKKKSNARMFCSKVYNQG